ncbi:YCII-related protein [Beutenbergia cavernae DSM 12333]|uniref:YCII-related protein n=1 Tax=Beutenbergia cavernae (strain ATCC BAA-8 / DSM 12333 / CCUG 43141 / JCM 11478 / NBRC 16432 / NCIMB 13614 / HKI 0122) TaxID=471853 RepID=C5C5W7_BEUC1|nr:YciI family protein [Beutenbergia cavernae]ACQ82325.1 YCII-related protein [Beutenbergia cavernae DSM 12333]
MPTYLLTIMQPGDGSPAPPNVLEPIMRDVQSFNAELREAGAWVFAGGLHPPSTATVIRPSGDDVLVTDGPYVEGKEHVGGLTVLEAPDLDAALEWGRKLARAVTIPVEVRPFQDGATT